MSSNIELFTCDCHFVSHHVVVDELRYNSHPEEDRVVICPTLNHYLPWYSRLKVAVKYVFGIDNTFDAYSEVLLDKENTTRLRDYLNRFLEN